MSEAVKHDYGKPRMDLASSAALLGLGTVLEYGAKKYGDHNWRTCDGLKWSRLVAAAQRHMLAFSAGEDLDPESGLPHIDHAACCLHFLSEYAHLGSGIDDRFKLDPPER